MNSGVPSDQELQAAAAWFEQRFALPEERDDALPAPLSFEYEGRRVAVEYWQQDCVEAEHSNGTVQRTLVWK